MLVNLVKYSGDLGTWPHPVHYIGKLYLSHGMYSGDLGTWPHPVHYIGKLYLGHGMYSGDLGTWPHPVHYIGKLYLGHGMYSGDLGTWPHQVHYIGKLYLGHGMYSGDLWNMVTSGALYWEAIFESWDVFWWPLEHGHIRCTILGSYIWVMGCILVTFGTWSHLVHYIGKLYLGHGIYSGDLGTWSHHLSHGTYMLPLALHIKD